MPLDHPKQHSQYGPNAICVVGSARASASTPIAVQYDKLLVVLILDRDSGTVLDAECNMVLEVTNDFVSALFTGRCFYTDIDAMIADVQQFYHGTSQRALTVCLKDAYAKMLDRGSNILPISRK